MNQTTVQAVANWLTQKDEKEPLEIIFHGGEPLLAGAEFYRQALPVLRSAWKAGTVKFSVQSNLWLLDDAICDVFSDQQVSLGTSLDGPEEINDLQRGHGYFRRTMAGIEKARVYGLPVGCISTYTAQSAPHWREVIDFFVGEGLSFSLHAALPALGSPIEQPWVLSAEAHGELLSQVFHFYTDHLKQMRIETMDALCRSVSSGKGGICTFGNCLGNYLAIGPKGEIYPCQRFAGMDKYRLGNVSDPGGWHSLEKSPVWQKFSERQRQIEEECRSCEFLDICKGGCPYNALAANGGVFGNSLRDPHCPAYRRIFTEIVDTASEEVFSMDNLQIVVDQPEDKGGLLRRGPVLSLMRKDGHPYETGQNARQALAAVALAASGSPEEALSKLKALGTVTIRHAERTLQALRRMDSHLCSPRQVLNNLYLHITFACPLHCSHCYAESGRQCQATMPPEAALLASRQAAACGFRHLVVTGGEPLVHPEIKSLLEGFAQQRALVKPLKTVLRTSLVLPMDADLMRLVANSTDEVVVSLDGDRLTHDARRGEGSYARTIENLRQLVDLHGFGEVSLAAVLPIDQMRGKPGQSVKDMAEELGIGRTRFRPVLPLGRAKDGLLDALPEAVWVSLKPEERVAYGFLPVASCGMGQNLYVEPDGIAYPCYAWHGKAWQVGNILDEEGLIGVVKSTAFERLHQHTVNTNQRCNLCALRYLCGGACRAWNRLPENAQVNLDAPPLDCSRLHERARSMLVSALNYLEISPERWTSAGLPLPDQPPEVV